MLEKFVISQKSYTTTVRIRVGEFSSVKGSFKLKVLKTRENSGFDMVCNQEYDIRKAIGSECWRWPSD